MLVGGLAAGSAGAGRLAPVLLALPPLLFARPALPVPTVEAVPGGGSTRSTCPTSLASGLDNLFQRTMFATGWRLSRAIFDSVSPRSTR